jgi:hypothetical protein
MMWPPTATPAAMDVQAVTIVPRSAEACVLLGGIALRERERERERERGRW